MDHLGIILDLVMILSYPLLLVLLLVEHFLLLLLWL
jgi:hypothetical protein